MFPRVEAVVLFVSPKRMSGGNRHRSPVVVVCQGLAS